MDQSNTRDETTGTPPGIPEPAEGAVITGESGLSSPDVEGGAGEATRAPAAAEPAATADVPLAIDLPAGLDHAGALQDFRHELARAMRSAAESERERITSAVEGIARAQLEQVRARAAAEADGFRQLADQDVDRIRDWSKAEISRIHDEAESRIGARRQQLERHVERHGSITDREVASIESAVEAYRAEVERFFARLTSEEDPAEFARLAATLPAPPDLDEIGGAARAQALDEYRARDATSTDATADARDQGSAFSPTEPGPGLVGVMASGDEATPGVPVMADPAATGEDAREPVPAASGDATQPDTNGALHRLRALAGFGGKREE
jgi:hypothetical protein